MAGDRASFMIHQGRNGKGTVGVELQKGGEKKWGGGEKLMQPGILNWALFRLVVGHQKKLKKGEGKVQICENEQSDRDNNKKEKRKALRGGGKKMMGPPALFGKLKGEPGQNS